MKRQLLALILFAALGCAACSSPSETPPPTSRKGDGWTGQPFAEWPHVALINQIDYADSNHPSAACGFLIDTGDGVVAATAKHVLRFFKSDTMDSVSFRGSLVEWRMFPKDDPSRVTVMGQLINADPQESLEDIQIGADWLLFEVADPAAGVKALKLRTTPLTKGETVYVVGWRYPDLGRQRILEGEYVESEVGTVLIDVGALSDNTIPGLSGAPVIDTDGAVIGLMSRKAGKLQRLASVDYPLGVLREAGRL